MRWYCCNSTFFFLLSFYRREAFTDAAQKRVQITEIQNLLVITREIKALWIKGPLRKPGEDAAQQAELDAKALRVQELYNKLMAQRLEGQRRDAEAKARGQGQAA